MLSLGTWKKLPPPQGLGETVLAFTKGSRFSHPQKRSQGALRLKSETFRAVQPSAGPRPPGQPPPTPQPPAQRQFLQALPHKLHAEAPTWGDGRTDTRFPCCVSNFSRAVPRTFFQVTQSPDSHTRPALAFPRSSAATHHPNPGWRRRVLRAGGKGRRRGEEWPA